MPLKVRFSREEIKSLKLILYPNVWQVAVLKNETEYFWAKKEGAVPTGRVHLISALKISYLIESLFQYIIV